VVAVANATAVDETATDIDTHHFSFMVHEWSTTGVRRQMFQRTETEHEGPVSEFNDNSLDSPFARSPPPVHNEPNWLPDTWRSIRKLYWGQGKRFGPERRNITLRERLFIADPCIGKR
jgi:hypothetical protein